MGGLNYCNDETFQQKALDFSYLTPIVPLTIYYQNVGGMRTKTNDFHLLTASCDYDVIVLTETWLRSDVRNTELSSDYNIYRCDRSSMTSRFQRGGGTLIAVKKSIASMAV